MNKAFQIWLIFSTISLNAIADIIPDPVKVKGIVPANVPVDIQMVSEVVTADLYKDISFVKCVFYMHNHGKSRELEVGFPVMNFYLWGDNIFEPQKNWLKDGNFNKFKVIVGNSIVNKVNLYIPKAFTEAMAQNNRGQNYKLIQEYNNANKPWYLWKVSFKENETVKIIVRYRLPAGTEKITKFFNYILSTGAGWKGKIKSAKIILNLKDVPADQIVELSPAKHCIRKGQQLVWIFSNLEPTPDDDILVRYEIEKGTYKTHMDKMPSFYIDGIRYNAGDKPASSKIKMASYDIKESDGVDKNGAPIFYTVNHALRKFKKKMGNYPGVNKFIKHETVGTLPLNYQMEINGTRIDEKAIFKQMLVVDTMQIKNAIISTDAGKQKVILLQVDKWTTHSGHRQGRRYKK